MEETTSLRGVGPTAVDLKTNGFEVLDWMHRLAIEFSERFRCRG